MVNRLSCTLFVAAMLGGAVQLMAQTSSLLGVVSDAQGAVVPGAVVTLTNTDTSSARKELTNEKGGYEFVQIPPGPYRIEIQKPGFETDAASLTLQVNEPGTVNFRLKVGQVNDVVNVSAESTQLNTQDATVGNPFTATQIQELPLQTRNVVALLSIQPGVSSGGQVLGSRPDQNNVVLDGADVNDNRGANGFNAVLPIPLDSVQEFRTTIAGQGADLGHSAGGQVSIVTKSGSNSFHGSAYEYNRNTDFEANDWFSNRAGVARPALIRNQYGFSAGGPIRKNKLFFFYNWEARKDRSQTSKSDTVPSDTLRQGIVQVLLKSGQTVQLTPAQVQAIDPLGIGENPAVLSLMQQYPHGNNPLAASDKGLNFNTLLFNAPQPLNNHAQVGRLDYNIDNGGKHTISVRGTLNGASQVATTEQFPGQSPVSQSQNNSRGLAARYTWVVSSNIVNTVNFGYTRLGSATTGNLNVIPSVGFTTLQATASGSSRIAPTPNITDDLTWSRRRHTIQAGMNFHQAQNITTNYRNEPSFSWTSANLLNLGNDITADVLSYIQKTIPTAVLASNSNVISVFGTILGIENAASATYNYGIDGKAIPFGTPVTRNFISNSPEFYVQDSWKARPNLTITAGLRYSIYGVPYEANGVEVVPQTSLNEYFGQRVGAAMAGIPNAALSTAFVTYEVGGPVNHGPGYYPTDYKDFAPRLAVAYSPTGGLREKILGKGSVLRAGAGIVYDNYGNAMASAFSSSASPGLATQVQNPVNTNFTTSARYPNLAPLTPPNGGAFPYTPPLVTGGFNQFSGVASDLKAPYEYLLNANYARRLPKQISIEVGYAGRLAHRAIINQDFGQPLTNFVDAKSGQSWGQATTVLANLYYGGLTTAQVKANPGLVPTIPFAQDIAPGLANHYITGSASANLFYDAYGEYAGSWGDTMNDIDRIRQSNGGCISTLGCNTFFPLQGSGLESYVNAGKSAFHAMTVSLRRTVTHGWGFDFNYTWSHAIDNGSSSETSGGSPLQNAFCPNCGLGPSDYDARHQVTADAVVALPVGKGKALLGRIPGWADQIVGGWQVTTLFTFRTGTPLSCTASGVYNSNYNQQSLCMLDPGVTAAPAHTFQFDQNGLPSDFANTNVGADFVPAYANTSGYRGIMRGFDNWNDDAAVGKFFRLPKEGMRLEFRAEAYNLLNHEIFSSPSLSISQLAGTTTNGATAQYGSSTFGEIKSSASSPRVLQMALRLTF